MTIFECFQKWSSYTGLTVSTRQNDLRNLQQKFYLKFTTTQKSSQTQHCWQVKSSPELQTVRTKQDSQQSMWDLGKRVTSIWRKDFTLHMTCPVYKFWGFWFVFEWLFFIRCLFFFFRYRSPLSYLCKVLDAISANIDKIVLIYPYPTYL